MSPVKSRTKHEEEFICMNRRTFQIAIAFYAIFILLAGVGVAQTVTAPRLLVGYPDLIVHNGKIVTMDDPSLEARTGRTVEAMAVRQGKVLALGTNAAMF